MIAIKEAMKLRQRAAYQTAKERREAAVAEQNQRQKERQADAAMTGLVKTDLPK